MKTNFEYLFILIMLIMASLIAFSTSFDRHPDERAHYEAFQYFKSHWWPADIGSEELYHSPYGWSRVYTGEIVYLIYGKLAYPLDLLGIQNKMIFVIYYRMLNVILFGAMLLTLFHIRSDLFDTKPFLYLILCIPQITYLFSYANSDAFAVAISTLLFLLVLIIIENDGDVSLQQSISLGVLLGLLLCSKLPYILSIILPLTFLAFKCYTNWKINKKYNFARVLRTGSLVLVIAVMIFSPFKFIYPLSQGNFAEKKELCNEKFAVEEYKPSKPSAPNYHISQKGETLLSMITQTPWLKFSLYSYYGYFGRMRIRLDRYYYGLALLGVMILFGITIYTTAKKWSNIPILLKLGLFISPALLVLNIYASMINSWTEDWQPQGKYLFPTLMNLLIMLTGTYRITSVRLKFTMKIMFMLFYILALSILYRFAFLKL